MSDVLPCPFCGKLAWTHGWDYGADKNVFYFIRCASCKSAGPSADTKGEALELWNDRKFDHMIGSAIGQKLQLAGRRETIQRILSWAKDKTEDGKVSVEELVFMLGQALVAENALVKDG